MRVLILVFSIFAACGAVKSPYSEEDDQLELYVEKFKLEAERFGIYRVWPDYIIGFANTGEKGNPNQVGYCIASNPKVIAIDRNFFSQASEEIREMLVFHELGHCLLGRKHIPNCRVDMTDPCPYPVSIMYPKLSAKDYKENREYYLKELFYGQE